MPSTVNIPYASQFEDQLPLIVPTSCRCQSKYYSTALLEVILNCVGTRIPDDFEKSTAEVQKYWYVAGD